MKSKILPTNIPSNHLQNGSAKYYPVKYRQRYQNCPHRFTAKSEYELLFTLFFIVQQITAEKKRKMKEF